MEVEGGGKWKVGGGTVGLDGKLLRESEAGSVLESDGASYPLRGCQRKQALGWWSCGNREERVAADQKLSELGSLLQAPAL